ncbi:hypothetical protein NLM33_47415 (plasmid) [Bradyrhizobium sp. CCGUVB1N3]|uniref:hypothetical protein n=1 Tax=Bradyrhizobium sp. CCGUVB1N3 TaxID=2949629 RepID=UPI0020B24C9C|nr:hypothetical protein [Bradyrhizobium sp. CCGUVB1N3]MCP3477753.1 hypothetical protein [Bradyrhizobium sp. CCGUVB1N3]
MHEGDKDSLGATRRTTGQIGSPVQADLDENAQTVSMSDDFDDPDDVPPYRDRADIGMNELVGAFDSFQLMDDRKRSFLRTYAVERGDGMRCPP